MSRITTGVILVMLVCVFALSGCAGVVFPQAPVSGHIYADVKGTSVVTSNVGASKMGVGEAKSILGLVSLGDASVGSAMADAGITKVQRVDYHLKNILGIYAELKVYVYGE